MSLQNVDVIASLLRRAKLFERPALQMNHRSDFSQRMKSFEKRVLSLLELLAASGV